MLRKLVRGGLVDLIAANFLMQFVGFGVLLVLPRFLDTAAFGQIRVMQSYADLFVILAGFGMNTAVLKACAGDVDEARLGGIPRTATGYTLLGGIAVVLLVAAATWMGVFGRNPIVENWLPVFALVVPLQAAALLFTAFLQARQRIRAMARAQLWVRIQSAVIILLATWAFGVPGFVGASILAALVALIPYVRLIGWETLAATRTRLGHLFRHVAQYSLLSNVLNTATKYADLYVLGLFAVSADELGHYALAAMLVLPVSVVVSSIQSTALPMLAERSGDRRWFVGATTRTQVQTVGIAVLAVIGIRLIAPTAIDLLYEPAYRAALPYLDVLLLHQVLRSGYAILGAGHIALGRTDHNFWASAIGAPVALAASWVALDQFGTAGIAWAKTLTAAALIGVYILLMRRAVRQIPESDGADA